MNTPSTDIFISYSRQDYASADRLERRLHAQGYTTWLDRRSLQGGQIWERELQTAIDNARTMIVLLSPSAVQSLNVEAEYTYAQGQGKPVIPVRIAACDLPPRLASAGFAPIDAFSSRDSLLPLVVQMLDRLAIPASRLPVLRRRRGLTVVGAVATLALLILVVNLVHAITFKAPAPPPYQVKGDVTLYVSSLVLGPDGNVWATIDSGEGALFSRIVRVTPTGVAKEFQLGAATASVHDLIVGPDHNLWFAEWGRSDHAPFAIGRITPTGEITEFSLDDYPDQPQSPNSLTVGRDGNLWFCASLPGSGLARSTYRLYTLSAQGQLLHAQPVPACAITFAPNGEIWASGLAGFLYHILPTGTSQAITYPTTLEASQSNLVFTADGTCWFWLVDESQAASVNQTDSMLLHFSGAGALLTKIVVPQFEYGFGIPPQLFLAPDGSFVLPNDAGILRYTPATNTFAQVHDKQGDISHVVIGPAGALWGVNQSLNMVYIGPLDTSQ